MADVIKKATELEREGRGGQQFGTVTAGLSFADTVFPGLAELSVAEAIPKALEIQRIESMAFARNFGLIWGEARDEMTTDIGNVAIEVEAALLESLDKISAAAGGATSVGTVTVDASAVLVPQHVGDLAEGFLRDQVQHWTTWSNTGLCLRSNCWILSIPGSAKYYVTRRSARSRML
jgi:hypothetical protein